MLLSNGDLSPSLKHHNEFFTFFLRLEKDSLVHDLVCCHSETNLYDLVIVSTCEVVDCDENAIRSTYLLCPDFRPLSPKYFILNYTLIQAIVYCVVSWEHQSPWLPFVYLSASSPESPVMEQIQLWLACITLLLHKKIVPSCPPSLEWYYLSLHFSSNVFHFKYKDNTSLSDNR